MTGVQREVIWLAGGTAAAVLGAMLLDPGLLFLGTEVLVLFFMAQMWNLLAGYGGQVSLGHQAFVGLGAYSLFLLSNYTGLSPWLALALIPVLVGAVSVPLGALLFNLRNAYFAVGMWVVAEILQSIAYRSSWVGGSFGMVLRPGGQIFAGNPERAIFLIGALACVLLMFALTHFLRSRFGLALLCIRDNEAAAASAGVNVRAVHLTVFAISAAGCAAAGGLFYMTALYVSPADAFQINWVVGMMFITIVGGLGSLAGPVVGTLIFVGVRELMTGMGFSGGHYWIVMGLIAVSTLLIAPRGLWPALNDRIAQGKERTVR